MQGSKAKKVVAVSTSEQKRLNKLPPRLARAKAEALKQSKPTSNSKTSKSDRGGAGDAGRENKESERGAHAAATSASASSGQTPAQLMKIENWDNDMAKSVAQQASVESGRLPVIVTQDRVMKTS